MWVFSSAVRSLTYQSTLRAVFKWKWSNNFTQPFPTLMAYIKLCLWYKSNLGRPVASQSHYCVTGYCPSPISSIGTAFGGNTSLVFFSSRSGKHSHQHNFCIDIRTLYFNYILHLWPLTLASVYSGYILYLRFDAMRCNAIMVYPC